MAYLRADALKLKKLVASGCTQKTAHSTQLAQDSGLGRISARHALMRAAANAESALLQSTSGSAPASGQVSSNPPLSSTIQSPHTPAPVPLTPSSSVEGTNTSPLQGIMLTPAEEDALCVRAQRELEDYEAALAPAHSTLKNTVDLLHFWEVCSSNLKFIH